MSTTLARILGMTIIIFWPIFLTACQDPFGLRNIPQEFDLNIDTENAIKAGLDHDTLQVFGEINETMKRDPEIGPETRQLIRELNNTLQNGARMGLDPNSLEAIARLTETIGAGLNLNISIDPVVVVVQVEPDTRDWLDELITEHAPGLASKLIGEVTVGTTRVSEEVKNDIIEILKEGQKNFGEVVSLVGIEGRCNADFLSGRVDNTLNQAVDSFVARITALRIKDVLLGEKNVTSPSALPKGVICRVSPTPLELVDNGGTLIPKEQHLDIVGYDFLENNLPDVRIYTIEESEFATLRVSRVSNYQMQVNLQTVGFSNVGLGAEIIFNWPDGERNTVIILQPGPTPVPTPSPTPTLTPTVEPCPVAVINGPDGYINVRSGPGTVYSVIGRLQNGPSPCVTGQALSVTNDIDPTTGQITVWWEVDFDGQRGWISGRFASVNCPESQCPPKLPPPTPVPPPTPAAPPPPPPPPIADFQCGPTQGSVPLTINCVDLSTNNPTGWLWEFGDGSISSSRNSLHTYNSVGQFIIKLTVTNNQGSNTKEFAYINVQALPPSQPQPPQPPPSVYRLDASDQIDRPGGGGSGGGSFQLSCPEGYVATGFRGRAGRLIDQIQLLCHRFTLDGSVDQFDPSPTASRGGDGGSPFTRSCNSNEMLVGAFGRAGARVDSLGGYCTAFPRTSPDKLHEIGGSGGSAYEAMCPDNYVITGISGRWGRVIDQINIICTRIIEH